MKDWGDFNAFLTELWEVQSGKEDLAFECSELMDCNFTLKQEGKGEAFLLNI